MLNHLIPCAWQSSRGKCARDEVLSDWESNARGVGGGRIRKELYYGIHERSGAMHLPVIPLKISDQVGRFALLSSAGSGIRDGKHDTDQPHESGPLLELA